MATKAASTSSPLATSEGFAGSTVRVIAEIFGAVGEGLRARNEFTARVGLGADPVEAAAKALRHAEQA